jgi:hypothetical protein
MIPVGAIIGALVIVGRLATKQSGTSSAPATPAVKTSRGSASFFNDEGAGVTVGLWLILPTLGWGLVFAAFAEGSWGSLGFGLGTLLFVHPWRIARVLFIPLGLHRAAFYTAWLSRVTWRRDKPGGPAVAAALALVHQKHPSPAALAWVDQKLATTPRSLQASGVTAMGLLAAARGQLDDARRLLESVYAFDDRLATTTLRRIAAEWLATDAAAEGDWARVRWVTGQKRTPSSRTLWLFDALARQLQQEPVTLWFWWLLAPRRLWTWRFVRTAARTPPRPRTRVPPPPKQLSPLGAALFSQLSLPKAGAVGDDVVAVAQRWEAALGSDSLRTHLFERVTLLGGGVPDDALDEVRRLVEAELAPRVPKDVSAPVSGPMPALIDAAVASRREALLTELEQRMDRLEARRQSKRELPPPEEWRELTLLMRTYTEAANAGGPSERALAFSTIRDRLVNFAVWLYNERMGKPVANAVFRFLQVEATLVGDEESAALNAKNANCTI